VSRLVTVDDVRSAAERVAGHVVRTPVVPAPVQDGERSLWIKPENLQPTGAFKLRGATNALSRLDGRQGVVTHSSGNHARALAFAANRVGLAATIVMPQDATPAKIAAVRELGATVQLVSPEQRQTAAVTLAAERHLALVPPYDHPDVIAGQGTVGLEICTDLPDVDVMLVPVGGGGLISGVAVAVKALCPGARVIGVEPELAGDAAESMRRGERFGWDVSRVRRTIADGLRAAVLGELTWQHIQRHVDAIITVTEDEIAEAVRVLATQFRQVAEPSGAVSTAGYLFHRDELPSGRTVAVLSGGNIDPTVLADVLVARPSA
jgi:threo-3-hydroxy-L-aspartate ammonia-lyase